MTNRQPATKPCKYLIRFKGDVHHYAKNWATLRPDPPSECPGCGCCGSSLGYKGSYPRQVFSEEGRVVKFEVHRYRCRSCGTSISFLPDFCVPYKRYAAVSIGGALAALLLLGASIRTVAFSKVNAASASVSAIREWLRQFRRNANNLRFFALPEAGLPSKAVGEATDDVGLFRTLSETAQENGAAEAEILPFWQAKLSEGRPPKGLFRALLVPGCVS